MSSAESQKGAINYSKKGSSENQMGAIIFMDLLPLELCGKEGRPGRQQESPVKYCKSGSIRGTLIFADFVQNSASANSKTRENICDILYAQLDT